MCVVVAVQFILDDWVWFFVFVVIGIDWVFSIHVVAKLMKIDACVWLCVYDDLFVLIVLLVAVMEEEIDIGIKFDI